jgi:hypothetical protein
MRSADAVYQPLYLMTEQGFRWEPDDVTMALVARDNLAATATDVADALAEFVDKFATGGGKLKPVERAELVGVGAVRGTKLKPGERGRIIGGKKFGKGAVGGIREAVSVLDSIKQRKMAELERGWLDGSVDFVQGHERYFIFRFAAGMEFLRLSWNKMFYATEQPDVVVLTLDTSSSDGYAGGLGISPEVTRALRESLKAQADGISEKKGVYVEVHSDAGEVLYISQPPSAVARGELETARQRAKSRSKISMGKAHKERRGAVPVTFAKNHHSREHFADREMFEALWDLDY